jgi:phenylacetate-CoA ligase
MPTDAPNLTFRSVPEGLVWPALAPSSGLAMLSMQYQFARSEWLPAQELGERQLAQLEVLLAHAGANVPYWRAALPKWGIATGVPLSWEQWRRIPPLRRSDVQTHQAELEATSYPRAHGGRAEQRTSGSTGTPVAIQTTQIAQMFWQAVTLRDDLWHRRDLSRTLAALRARGHPGADPHEGAWAPVWHRGAGAAFVTGPSILFPGDAPTAEQAEWLGRKQPDYMISAPTVLRGLLDETRRLGIRLERLKAAITYAETVPPGLRERVAREWGVPVQDIYSCREVGYIALQCPDFPHYHVQSETVLVEVVDDEGNPCAPGTIGRVLLTSLHNFAMPLLRYEIGDHAEVGPACPCGRGLPVLARILGRARNRIRHANGDRTWPNMLPLEKGLVDLPVAQYQLAQRALDALELRIVPRAPLSAQQERRLRGLIADCGITGFEVTIRYLEALARNTGDKSEDFVCELPEAETPLASRREEQR